MSILKNNSSIFSLITFSAFVVIVAFSCKKTEDNKTPHADYIFRGIVKSAQTSQPIKNIKVSITNLGNKNTSTNENGAFNFEYDNVDLITDWYFKFEDIDSTENGLFENKDTTIILNSSFFHDYNGEYYTGRLESDVTITLKSK
ncbi:MAG: hypothetical protein AUJ97_03780 [Bacteroidetes bacterium CG2_30_32_10]|nr:MAG: hypothetical protein AUJ97_03780 [Bacteroidetes bacterium CG2_30_32_10]